MTSMTSMTSTSSMTTTSSMTNTSSMTTTSSMTSLCAGDSDGDLKLGDSDGDKVKVDSWEGKMPGSLTLSANDLGWSCELFPYAINGQPVILLEGGAGIDGWWKLFIYQDSTDCYVEANVYGLDATNAFEEDDMFMSLSLPQKAAYLWTHREP